MNILITGGSGFVGSYLIEKLKKKHNIINIDIKQPEKNKEFFIEKDIREDLNDLPEIDVIFHLAAQSSVFIGEKKPEETFSVNIDGTKNLLKFAEKRKIKNFIFFSSAAVYGNPEEIPLKEESPKNPINNYGKSKLDAEKECLKYKENFNITILRPFNIYGPGSNGVIDVIVEKIKNNETFFIEGDGSQTRDFIFIKDVVNACDFFIDKKGLFNLGTGKETSLNDIINKINAIMPIKTEKKDKRKNDIERSVADISKLIESGFKPKYDIQEGLGFYFNERSIL